MRPSVSACVIARDEEDLIVECLASLAFADECIVVLDDRSDDSTEARARAAGARVLRRRYEGNVEQKNFAVEQAKHDWIVSLDADEALSPELCRAMQAALEGDEGRFDGYLANRVTFHLGRWIRHGDFHPDWQLRLFRRTAGRWRGQNPHGRVAVAGAVGRLRGDLLHRSFTNLADQVDRIQRYSTIQARGLHAAGRRARLRDLVLRPPARFARGYVLRGGWRDGVPGFVIASAIAFQVFLKYAKLWELERAAPAPRDAA